VIYGGAGAGAGSTTHQLPATFTKVASRCEHLVAWKIPIRGVMTGKNSLEECVQTLAAVGRKTQRTVSPLVAGDLDFLAALKAGAKGNVNSNESVRVDDNTAIYKAFRAGDLAAAQAIQDRNKRLSDVLYGIGVGRSYTFFHYRGKIAAWMLGYIPNPFMRLPQVPPPADEIRMLFDALVASGRKPVREAGEFEHAARAFRQAA
jgi:dihydrodipicolinate synthase/N-acetylneuraminate lyase